MINIVLFQPQIPQNTGNIARTCAVTGAKLHLIGPMGFVLDDKKMKRAGLTYWDILDVTYYENFDEFWEKHSDKDIFLLSSKTSRKYTDAQFKKDAFLLFGREDTGVTDEIATLLAGNAFRVPMLEKEGARCLNLATTVGIVTYEALRQLDFKCLV